MSSPARSLVRTCFGLMLALTLAAPRPARAAWPTSPNNPGLALRSGASGNMLTTNNVIKTVTDGAGGLIAVWVDERNFAVTGYDIYAQRVSAAGTVLWAASGAAVTTAAGDQGTFGNTPYFDAVPDGNGGVCVVWMDGRNVATGYDIYAQHLDASGNRTWNANDVAVCTAANTQKVPVADRDGLGGMIVAWADFRSGTSYDIYARRVLSNGTLSWTSNGTAICTDAATQDQPVIVATPIGGAIIVWADSRSTAGPYAQRVSPTGSAMWTTNGIWTGAGPSGSAQSVCAASDGLGGVVVMWSQNMVNTGGYDIGISHVTPSGTYDWAYMVCDDPSDQYALDVQRVSDGSYVLGWSDERGGKQDIYAQRLSPGGYPYWADDGVAVTTSTNPYIKTFENLVPDGDGGVMFAFNNGVGPDVFAQRVNANGSRRWTSSGVPVCVATGGQRPARSMGDDAGGLFVLYVDSNLGPYVAHVDANGQMLDPRPAITRVKDVLNDQGGQLLLEWSASALDGDPAMPISQYLVWRKVPIASVAALASHAAFDDDGVATLGDRTIRRTGTALLPTYWEFVQSQAAYNRPGYSLVVSTTSDSTPTSNPRTWYMVTAQKSDGTYWDSAPDSGYSVDNLPPGTPAPFTANYAAGVTHLHWGTNHEADLAGYRVYRGTTAGFPADAAHLVAAVSDTGLADAAGAPYFYKLTAVDAHGNESPVASLMPSGTLDAPGAHAAALALAAPSPNPLRAGERSALRFALPVAAHARVTLVDAQGRAAATLADRTFEAGEHSLAFAAHDARGGALSPGLYFVVLETRGERLARRLVLLR